MRGDTLRGYPLRTCSKFIHIAIKRCRCNDIVRDVLFISLLAARYGDTRAVSMFTRNVCEVRLPGKDGLNPEMIALKYAHGDLAETFNRAREQGMYRHSFVCCTL